MTRPTALNPGYPGPGVYMVVLADRREHRMYVEPILDDDWRAGWLRFSDDETRMHRGSWDMAPQASHLVTMRKVGEM